MATIKGKMVYIYPVQQLTSKSGNAFQKRDFVFAVQRFDPDTGEVSVDEDNTPMLSVTGDRCALLDRIKAGDHITVTYSLRGRRYRRDDGKEAIINDIDVRAIRLDAIRPEPVEQPVSTSLVETAQPAQQGSIDDLPF